MAVRVYQPFRVMICFHFYDRNRALLQGTMFSSIVAYDQVGTKSGQKYTVGYLEGVKLNRQHEIYKSTNLSDILKDVHESETAAHNLQVTILPEE